MRRSRGKMGQYAADMQRISRERYQERIVASAVLGGMDLVLSPLGYHLLPYPSQHRRADWGLCYATQYKAARAWLKQQGITI